MRQNQIITLMFVVALTFVPLAVQAKDSGVPPLSLLAALEKAYQENPTLHAARAEFLSVYERVPQALAGLRPTVNADLSVLNTDTQTETERSFLSTSGANTSKQAELNLTQPLYSGGRTTAQVKSARAAVQTQEEFLRTAEQSVLLDAATAYLDVVRDQALLNLSRNNKELIARQLEATQDRFDVGELTLTDVSQARARLARAEANVTAAKGDLKASKAVFVQVIGQSPRKLLRPRVVLPVPDTIDAALDIAQDNSPVVRAANFVHETSKNDIDDAFGRLLPQVDFTASLSKAYDPTSFTGEQDDRVIGLRATIPLYSAGADRSRVRQAKYTANQRYIEVLETKRQVRQDVVRAWEVLATARAEISSREAQVKASEVAREGVHEETNIGVRTVLEALDADQELLDAQVALVSAQRNELVAQFSLLAVLGKLSPQVFGFEEQKVNIHVDRDIATP